MKKPEIQHTALKFTVSFDEQPKENIEVVAYAFTPQGRLLNTAPVKANVAELDMPLGSAANARIFLVGKQPAAERSQQLTLSDMPRLHAYEPSWKFEAKRQRYELLPIPEIHWRWWLWARCRVRGMVVSPVEINGVTIEKPVADALVHICEVDRLYILIKKLPDRLIFRLRDEWLNMLSVMDPIRPIAGEIKQLDYIDAIARSAINPQPEPPGFHATEGRNMLRPQPEPPAYTRLALADLSAETRAKLSSQMPEIVRETIVSNLDLILPFFCHWPWLHRHICHKQELATDFTDHNGRFDATIWYQRFGDKPDIYCWVECLFQGKWVTVYKPFVCCHTYWNYLCGTEITIRVTDPRVQPCDDNPDLPNHHVVVTTIGNQISMSEIVHSPLAAGRGMTDGKPFAGTLELRCDMSRSNLIGDNITHYRWSYRRLTHGDGLPVTPAPTAADWQALSTPVYRYHKIMVTDPGSPGGLKPTYEAVKMGPDPDFPKDSLFKIQPIAPPAGSAGWQPINEHVDLAWAYFPTSSLLEPDPDNPSLLRPAAGKYELKLELFSTVSGVARVNWTNPVTPVSESIKGFIPSNPAPFLPPTGMDTVAIGTDNIFTDDIPGGDTLGFKMVLHIDNNPCQASIDETWADSNANTAGPCGFVRFASRATSLAHLTFKAYHPYNFAVFKFQVDKGSSGSVPEACADFDAGDNLPAWAAVAGPTVNGFTRNVASIFTKAVPVQTLLLLDAKDDDTYCNEAAFAETLAVHATAVDGYNSRAYWLDAYATSKAFALAQMLPVVVGSAVAPGLARLETPNG